MRWQSDRNLLPKAVHVLLCAAFVTSLLAGCLHGDDLAAGPRAVVSMDALSADTYRFDASGSTGRGLTFAWSFGDGATSTEPVAEHTYTYGDGTYTVRLVVVDENDQRGDWSDEIVIGTGRNEPPTAHFTLRERVFAPGESVRVDASRSTDPENDPLEYRWDFNHLMSFEEYKRFRAAKDGPGSAPAGGDDGKRADGLLPRLGGLLGPKNGNHADQGQTDCTPNLFMHTLTTTEPVHVFADGYADATCFFIRLQVYDVKGAHEAIVSEDIWPVMVTDEPPPRILTGSVPGVFDIGAPKDVTDHLPDNAGEFIAWEFETTFPTDSPAELAYVNVTFNENLLGGSQPTLGNSIYMKVTAPDMSTAETLAGGETGGKISTKWEQPYDDPGFGTWRVYLAARFGWDIEWELTWWIRMDANPFLALEHP